MMKYLLTMICTVVLLVSCDDDGSTQHPINVADRTVIVYMSAENNLSSYASDDINEMVAASKLLSENVNLVAFVDRSSRNTLPYILKIRNGEKVVDENYNCAEDFYSCDPERMHEVLEWIMEQYPANSYGLVLWGHASGWLIESDTIANDNMWKTPVKRAYGIDSGEDLLDGDGSKWINVPSLAKVLEALPAKFKFIFADCCNFQTVETAYELRNVTEYIIASPAETPVIGAPYDEIVPYMFSTDDDFYCKIADGYNSMVINGNDRVPMSVIRTSEMVNLAEASREMMQLLAGKEILDTKNLIYYRGYGSVKVMLDINDLMMRNVGMNEAYDRWKEALDRAVIYRAMSGKWLTDRFVSFDFNMTEDRFGGVSVFIPQSLYDTRGYDYNSTIRQMQWYYAAGVDNYYTGIIKNQECR